MTHTRMSFLPFENRFRNLYSSRARARFLSRRFIYFRDRSAIYRIDESFTVVDLMDLRAVHGVHAGQQSPILRLLLPPEEDHDERRFNFRAFRSAGRINAGGGGVYGSILSISNVNSAREFERRSSTQFTSSRSRRYVSRTSRAHSRTFIPA